MYPFLTLFWILIFQLTAVYSRAIPSSDVGQIQDVHPFIIRHQSSETTVVSFLASCPACGAGFESGLPLELSLSVANGRTSAFLNEDTLIYSWAESSVNGSGVFSQHSMDRVLSASWQSTAISAPSESSAQHSIQVLTVMINRVNEVDLGKSSAVGFTALFTQDTPEIIRLCTPPWNSSIHHLLSANKKSLTEMQCTIPPQVKGYSEPFPPSNTPEHSTTLHIQPRSQDPTDTNSTSKAYTAIITLLIVFALALRLTRNTTYCRRKRADRAASREERHTRRAYRSAARRLRWRQWCGGGNGIPLSRLPPISEDEDILLTEREQDQDQEQLQEQSGFRMHDGDSSEYRSRDKNGAMKTEIRDLGQTLDHVGKLVKGGPVPNMAVSSTVSFSTNLTTGTGSVESSSVSVETPPPSYHS